MDINCPECGASFFADNSTANTCPACMFTFSINRETSLPHLMEIEVQGQDSKNIGTMDIYKIKEMIYAGRINGKELVRPLNGDWIPIGDLKELSLMFRMKGIDLVSVKVQAQRVKGWKTKNDPKPKKRRKAQQPAKIIETRNSINEGQPKKVLVPLLVIVAAIAAAAWLYSS